MNKTILLILTAFIFLFPAFSEDQIAEAEPSEKKDTFSFSADNTEAILASGRERTTLTGNAVIITNNKEIHADFIEIYGQDFEIAECSGNVVVIDMENETTLTCSSLKFNRSTEVIVVRGYSEMEDRKNELIAKSGYIEEKSKEKFTTMQIGVRILKIADNEEMTCRSEYAGYDREANILELTGNPRVYWKGDTYIATRIVIDLDTDEIKLEGNVSGSITSEKE